MRTRQEFIDDLKSDLDRSFEGEQGDFELTEDDVEAIRLRLDAVIVREHQHLENPEWPAEARVK